MHVLYTRRSRNFEQCLMSGICYGYSAKVAGDPCKHHVRKLSGARSTKPDDNFKIDLNDYVSQDGLRTAIESIYESVTWKSICYRLPRQRDCEKTALTA